MSEELKNCMQLYILRRVEGIGEHLTKNDLSNIIVNLDAKGFNMAYIFADIKGFNVRGIDRIIDRYTIYRIIDSDSENIRINPAGIDYIEDKVKQLSDDFKKAANKEISTYFINKYKSRIKILKKNK